MKINKFFKGIALASCALMLTGCASDYLDTPSYGSVAASDIAKTTEYARMTMLGVCGRGMSAPWGTTIFPAQPLMMGEIGVTTYLGEIPGSDNYINFIFDQAPSWAILYNQDQGMLSSGGYVWNVTMWNYCYGMIGQLNDLLVVIDDAEGSEYERNYTKAQALALRAHCYFRLLQVYGPRWEDSNNGEKEVLVLRTVPATSDNLPLTTMNNVLAQIYADLDEAIALFQASGNYSRTFTYEPTLNIAYGIYARVAALKHDWEKCRTMAHNARQGYEIASSEDIFKGYMEFNNKEWMWSPSFHDIDNFIYGNWCTFFACNAYGANNGRYTNRINIELYRQLPQTDERSNWWMTSEKLTGTVPMMYYHHIGVNPANQQFILEALLEAGRTWLDSRKPKNCTGMNAYAGKGVGESSTAIMCDGAQVKFWCNGETGQDGVCFPPYMRATEMWLYEAEACAELGLTADAQALLLEVNKPRNASYTCTKTGQALIDEVRFYRRIELWGEGFNWFDLKRWNIPMERKAWVEFDMNSGNIPAGLAVTVPVEQNYGWRHGIPINERTQNPLITSPIPGENVVDTEE